MTEQAVIDEWRERRDLTLAVKERIEHQLRVLNIEVVPLDGPDADQMGRLEELRYELSQLREAHEEAEEKYLTYSQGASPDEEGRTTHA